VRPKRAPNSATDRFEIYTTFTLSAFSVYPFLPTLMEKRHDAYLVSTASENINSNRQQRSLQKSPLLTPSEKFINLHYLIENLSINYILGTNSS